MLEKIKKTACNIATTAGSRKRTTLNSVDRSVFEDIEMDAKQLLKDIAVDYSQ